MAEKRKKRKKKNSRGPLILAVIVAICVVVAAVLYFSGTFDIEKIESAVNNKVSVAYIDYSGQDDSNMTINSEGRVLDSLSEAPEDIPKLTGLEFTRIVEGDLLEYENEAAYDYAMSLVMALRKYGIYVSEINIDGNGEASALVNDIVILFGSADKTEQKVADLNDFFDQVKDLKGTLHMEEVNDRVGYTFKQERETALETPVAVVDSETTTEEESSEENTEEYYEEEWQDYYEEPVYDEWQDEDVEEYYIEDENVWDGQEEVW